MPVLRSRLALSVLILIFESLQFMSIHKQIKEIELFHNNTFNEVDKWFDKNVALREFNPGNKGWNINQILEHIGLTSHFLLILIDKGCNKALQNMGKANLDEELKNYQFNKEKLTEVGLHQSFKWIRPEHMEPKGEKSSEEVRLQIKTQLHQCIAVLNQLKNGEGVLFKITMSVNNLGKIDVYEYIYFLGQHALRHITQMEKVEKEYLLK